VSKNSQTSAAANAANSSSKQLFRAHRLISDVTDAMVNRKAINVVGSSQREGSSQQARRLTSYRQKQQKTVTEFRSGNENTNFRLSKVDASFAENGSISNQQAEVPEEESLVPRTNPSSSFVPAKTHTKTNSKHSL